MFVGQHVGRLVLAAVAPVQATHDAVGGEDDRALHARRMRRPPGDRIRRLGSAGARPGPPTIRSMAGPSIAGGRRTRRFHRCLRTRSFAGVPARGAPRPLLHRADHRRQRSLPPEDGARHRADRSAPHRFPGVLPPFQRVAQAGAHAVGRSTWLRSPVITIRVPSPMRVRNIFICIGGGVLRLVQDGEGSAPGCGRA